MDKITRRQALGLAGSAGAALLVARNGLPQALAPLSTDTAEAAGTTVTPSMTEGPYWIDELLRRSDVRANTSAAGSDAAAAQEGVPLSLKINVFDADNGNKAVNGAHVDIWHANAYGLYSDEASQQVGGGTTSSSTKGQNFLRGYQVTGADAGLASSPVDGQVSFKTIWPGWYSGRAIHIHVRVRTYDSAGNVATNYTTQIFFSDAANNAVLTGAAPYSTRSPQSDPTTDENDNVLTSTATATNVVSTTGSNSAGYDATFTIYLTGVKDGTEVARTTDTSVSATLASARAVNAAGVRSVVLSVKAGETLTASAKVVRGTTVLGSAKGQLPTGAHSLKVGLGKTVAAGTAKLQLRLADAAGNVKTLTRTVHVPAAG
jgi:protocatechuate 3,4-dioxygenase beta subunit